MPESLLRVLTCGSVDDGKSTLIGRMLFECGTIPDDVLVALENDSRRFGTVEGGVDYALLVDGVSEVMSLKASAFERNPPTLAKGWVEFSSGIYRLEGRLLVVLDVGRLLNMSEAG